jgi:hypothetical protein
MPMFPGPVAPTPKPRKARPSVSSFKVAMALAVTVKWRTAGWVTPGPISIRFVAIAMAPAKT